MSAICRLNMKVLNEKIGWKKVQYLDPGLQGGDVINIAQLRRHAPRSLLRHSLLICSNSNSKTNSHSFHLRFLLGLQFRTKNPNPRQYTLFSSTRVFIVIFLFQLKATKSKISLLNYHFFSIFFDNFGLLLVLCFYS